MSVSSDAGVPSRVQVWDTGVWQNVPMKSSVAFSLVVTDDLLKVS